MPDRNPTTVSIYVIVKQVSKNVGAKHVKSEKVTYLSEVKVNCF
jgi:hypothetical protein